MKATHKDGRSDAGGAAQCRTAAGALTAACAIAVRTRLSQLQASVRHFLSRATIAQGSNRYGYCSGGHAHVVVQMRFPQAGRRRHIEAPARPERGSLLRVSKCILSKIAAVLHAESKARDSDRSPADNARNSHIDVEIRS